ncbi:MAG: signal recognition particle-docking protein FtsY [Bacillales bacterium]|nr:signal recognition particle-docking protein FtsY [Bacillales bacterium]
MGFFSNIFKSKEEKEKAKKMKIGLNKTRAYSFERLKEVLLKKRKVDEAFYTELEEALLMADMGIDFTSVYMDALKKRIKKEKISSTDELKDIIIDQFKELYIDDNKGLKKNDSGLTVYLFVGVNGSGKTTSIAKVASLLKTQGKRVMIAAGDTYRAGAIDQLNEWGEKLSIPVISKKEGSDPSSVIFEAIKEAKSKGCDYLLCDTAGRLQTKVNLMKELEKIYRVIGREISGAPEESFLVIDATTGQNGLNQAKVFFESAKITGIILTKLDGSAKGGIVLSINNALKIPVKLYGSGEKASDIDFFDIDAFLYSIFSGILTEEE